MATRELELQGIPKIYKDELLKAMRADMIPAAWSGVWFVEKMHIPEHRITPRKGKMVVLPAGDYTYLRRLTDSTLYKNQPGEVVMEDTPFELATHVGFIREAFGSVLVGGLGLGCVLRGLLTNPRVEHITCIENSKDVLKLVAPHMPTDRLTIVEADMLVWAKANTEKFDCGWYDLWTNADHGEPHLDVWHAQLFVSLYRTVKHQGAWAFNRSLKKKLLKSRFPWMG